MMFQDMLLLSFLPMNPDDRLLELLGKIFGIRKNQMFDIILVDDGSGADFAPLFDNSAE